MSFLTWISWFIEPTGCFSLCGLLLLGMSFLRFGHSSPEKRRSLLEGREQSAIAKQLEALQAQEKSLLQLFAKKEKDLMDREEALQQLMERASTTADCLERTILRFEEVFFASNNDNPSVVQTFDNLKESLASEVSDLRSRWNRDGFTSRIIKGAFEPTEKNTVVQYQYQVSNIGTDIGTDIGTESEESYHEPYTDSFTRPLTESSEVICPVTVPKKENKVTSLCTHREKSTIIRRLLKQGLSEEEIIQETGLSSEDVSMIVQILKGQWKVA